MSIATYAQLEQNKIMFRLHDLKQVKTKLIHLTKSNDNIIARACESEKVDLNNLRSALLTVMGSLLGIQDGLQEKLQIESLEFDIYTIEDFEKIWKKGPEKSSKIFLNKINIAIKIINFHIQNYNTRIKELASGKSQFIKPTINSQASKSPALQKNWTLSQMLAIMSVIGCSLAFFDMPSPFYIFLKFLLVATCILLIIKINNDIEYKKYKNILFIILGSVIVIYNPILPMEIERVNWEIINIITICIILYCEFKKNIFSYIAKINKN
jgi:hypothetical protein